MPPQISYVAEAVLFDLFSPSWLALIFCFVVLLQYSTVNKGQVLLVGSIFIVNVFLLSICNNLGMLVVDIRSEAIRNAARIFYFIVGSGYVFIGCKLFLRWWRLRSSDTEEKEYLLKVRDKLSAGNKVLLVFCSIISSIFLTLFSFVWPAHYYISYMGVVIAYHESKVAAISSVFIYQLFLTLPFVLLMLFFCRLLDVGNKDSFLNRHPLRVKILLSSMFFALGASLIVIFGFKLG